MKQRIAKYIILGSVVATAVILGISYGRNIRMQHQLAKKVVRFHVVANSDSEADQKLKLLVRDAVGGYLQEKMEQVESKEACKAEIMESIPTIETLAKEVIAGEGFDYSVNARLQNVKFPEKTYGEYTFPKGTYEALKITIGEGGGQNWWCVMYPNMCFENSMYEVVGEDAQENLRKVLDEEEYQYVLEQGNYEIRFRFLEFFRETL